MDYIEGADWVGRLSPEPAVRLAREAAYAVQVLHDAGVVHRDLKPSNLLVDSLRAAVGTATVRRAGRCLLGRPQRRDAPRAAGRRDRGRGRLAGSWYGGGLATALTRPSQVSKSVHLASRPRTGRRRGSNRRSSTPLFRCIWIIMKRSATMVAVAGTTAVYRCGWRYQSHASPRTVAAASTAPRVTPIMSDVCPLLSPSNSATLGSRSSAGR
jgi:hypothetical protein